MAYNKIYMAIGLLLLCSLIQGQCLAKQGQTYPERIISLSPIITENIYLLGADSKLIANTFYCVLPEAAQKKEKIGTLIDVNLEKIIHLKPDLILATELAKAKQIKLLKKMGIRIVQYPKATTYDDMCTQFLDLADLIGKRMEAERIITSAKKYVLDIYHRVSFLPKKRIFFQIGTKPLHTVNNQSFMNDYILFSGGINIASNESSGIYSRENVIKNNPEIIFIASMGIASDKEKDVWMSFPTLDAAIHNRIYIIDSVSTCSVTPVSFVNALKKIAQYVHPEAFQSN